MKKAGRGNPVLVVNPLIDALFNDSLRGGEKDAGCHHVAARSDRQQPGQHRDAELQAHRCAPSFTAELKQALGSGNADQLAGLQPKLEVDPDAVAQSRDGNTVNLESELANLQQNTMAHGLETQLVSYTVGAPANGHHRKSAEDLNHDRFSSRRQIHHGGAHRRAHPHGRHFPEHRQRQHHAGRLTASRTSASRSCLKRAQPANGDSSGAQPQPVQVARIEADNRPPLMVYSPGHPNADKNGMVAMPNINIHEEMADLITSSRSFEANLAVLKNAQAMAMQTLSIGKR
jgi:flagellar basal-body rod protein FlgC